MSKPIAVASSGYLPGLALWLAYIASDGYLGPVSVVDTDAVPEVRLFGATIARALAGDAAYGPRIGISEAQALAGSVVAARAAGSVSSGARAGQVATISLHVASASPATVVGEVGGRTLTGTVR